MTVIENVPVTNADIPEKLLSLLPIRDRSVVSSLTDSSAKVSGGWHKGERNKITVDTIKKRLTDCGSPIQHILAINAILKYPRYSEQIDQVGIINTEQDLPTIMDILNKIDKRNDEIVSSDVNIRQRVRARQRLISKSSSECSIDQEAFYFSVDGKTRISDSAARTAKSRASNKILLHLF